MRLAEHLDEDLVVPDLSARTKAEVLAELVASLIAAHPDLDHGTIVQILADREKLGTTGIGDGIAIPHGKLDCIDRVHIIVARSLHGVDFASLDHKPATMFVAVLAPSTVAGLHLKLLAHVSRIFRDESFRHEFMTATGRDGLWNILQKV